MQHTGFFTLRTQSCEGENGEGENTGRKERIIGEEDDKRRK
jgi:hypothetical protein